MKESRLDEAHQSKEGMNDKIKEKELNLKPHERKIGQYILGKTIGEGTFGKVKIGKHILTNAKVAVKILEKSKIADVADYERVSREIHILKIVQHPNVVQLYEIIETQKKLYLIMEFCAGGELFDYIVKHQRVQEKEACRFF
jgi:5'-AMP-activated protein kinase, catalytic alpha subunit